MKRFVLSVFSVLVSIALAAQNGESEFERYKRLQEEEMQQKGDEYARFADDRQAEYENFKKRYEDAFAKYKRNYLRYLDDQESLIDLMASDDGIKIEPVKMAQVPATVSSSASEEIKRLRFERKEAEELKPEEVMVQLSESKDSLIQVKEAAVALEEINKGFEQPETEAAAPQELPQDTVKTRVPEVAANLTAAVPDPHGKPTDYSRISSPFGPRIHPITHRNSYHTGVDLKAVKMTPIYATADGVVTWAAARGGYGNFIKINHRNGYKTAYAHLHRIAVENDVQVRKGELIGYVGTTGNSTGDHLHYEVYYMEKLLNPVTTF